MLRHGHSFFKIMNSKDETMGIRNKISDRQGKYIHNGLPGGGGIMTRKKAKYYILGILFLLILIAGGCSLYISQVQKSVQGTVERYMNEIAEHDMTSLSNKLHDYINLINATADRVRVNDPSSVQEMCDRLNMESASVDYQRILLVDDTGTCYSSINRVVDLREKEYVKRILAGEEEFCMHYDAAKELNMTQESLIFGKKVTPFKVEDRKIIGILGIVNVNSKDVFGDSMKIDIYDGMGISCVIDKEGNYIINPEKLNGIGKIENLFENIEEFASKEEINAVKDSVAQNRAENFTIGKAERMFISVIPFEDLDWYFVMKAPDELISGQINNIVHITVVVLGGIIFLLIVLAGIAAKAAFTYSDTLEKTRSSFLSSMSHEIRTPLNGIIGLNKLMVEHLDDKEKMKMYLRKSEATSQYLLSLVSDVLDVSKLRAGKMEIINYPISIEGIVDNTETIIRSRMISKSQSFSVNKEIHFDTIMGDKTHVQQVLLNILSNATKYTPSGGKITLSVSQEISADHKVTTIFTVADTGIGMSKEFQKEIFKDFSREMSKVSDGTTGTGLGMSISYMLAKAMNGDITVESELNKGSTFQFILISEITDRSPENVSVIDPVIEEPKKSYNILAAEDNELNAEILMTILQENGMTATHAANGKEVLKYFMESDEYEYDFILMDIQVPIMNGYEAAKEIRSMKRADAQTIPIIACSADAFQEDKDRARESGMNDFAAKPIDFEILLRKMDILMKAGGENR